MAAPFIEVRGVSKSFATKGGMRHVLRHVSLSVDRGEFVSIVGAMGTGKSTLLAVIAGLANPDEGSIDIAGEPQQGVRSDIGFVFQNYSLLPWLTALENVRLGVEAAFPTLTRDEQRERARKALGRVGLSAAQERRPRQLSGGMRQRVAIARALATDPKIVLLDDPFGALDALTRETLQQQLVDLCSAGDEPVTVVMVTNNIDEAILLSDRIIPVIPGPPATLGRPVPVPMKRPRSAAQLTHDDEAIDAKGRIVAALTDGVQSLRPRTPRSASAGATASTTMMPAAIAMEERQ